MSAGNYTNSMRASEVNRRAQLITQCFCSADKAALSKCPYNARVGGVQHAGGRGRALPGAGGSVRQCRVLQLRVHCLCLCRKLSSSLSLPGGTQTHGNNILIWVGVKALHRSTGSRRVLSVLGPRGGRRRDTDAFLPNHSASSARPAASNTQPCFCYILMMQQGKPRL